MTAPILRVSPGALRELAQRCGELAGQVAPVLPTVAVPGWQSSGAATNAVNASSSAAANAMRGRMMASCGKLTTAAAEYEATDADGAADLAAVPQRRAGIPALVPRSGGDGGSGGLGTGR